MDECKKCCYFAVTDDPFWNGNEHCCFHEWGHGDWEKAPCDEDWEREERESYADSYPEEEWIERR